MRLKSMDSHPTGGVAAQADAVSKARCSRAKTSWIDAFGQDGALSSAPAATKKCRFAADDRDTVASATEALDGTNKPMRPMGAPPGLFDFHTEAQEIRKNFPKDWKKRLQQLKERAKATKYFYNDRQTLMVAVDLYNCSNKVYRQRHCNGHTVLIWDTTRLFECKDVVGNHTLPCDECGEVRFRKECDVYFCDYWGSSKVCMGCMGRNVCSLFGTDREAIAAKLNDMNEMHKKTRRFVGASGDADGDFECCKDLEP